MKFPAIIDSMKRIKLKILKETDDMVAFIISEQTHRDNKFSEGDDSNTFKSSVHLVSCSYPDWNQEDNTLYVRGLDKSRDEEVILVRRSTFDRILSAIIAYNTAFAAKPKIVKSKTKPKFSPKDILCFQYKNTKHPRGKYYTISFAEENSYCLKGIDVNDGNRFKAFLKKNIVGRVHKITKVK